MKALTATLVLITALALPQGKRTFSGVLTDSMCEGGNHSRMRMGPTDAECTIACVEAHGALFMLYDGKETYTLSDQQSPRAFAGKRVVVTGTLDAKTKTIHVESIMAAK